MAVVTLEEAKQYLRVDSADEDGFISGLLETGESMCADMARMEAGELEGHLPMARIAVLYVTAYICMSTGSRRTMRNWCRLYAPCCSVSGRKCSDGGGMEGQRGRREFPAEVSFGGVEGADHDPEELSGER
jgi:hypothetical protein